VNVLDRRVKCFRKHVLSLKHLLLLNLTIFKLKCNNLTFNEILILYASYVCLLHSRFVENHPIWILEDGPLISKVVLSQSSSQSSSGSTHLHRTDQDIVNETMEQCIRENEEYNL
jgi:hypothetical protein